MIHVLDQNTINQIAAGEVIERPASVVKELLENAIDAKATAVTVEIRDGGISLIRVTDNGCGIAKDDIPVAFLSHATSKIQSAADLVTVSSLGFRGEALSSIASVAQVELITKTPDSLAGSRYQIEGGLEKGLQEIGAPDGTTILVRNLFYNTPVRRKFLKTAMTEGGRVADLVEKIALSHPDISIRLIQNDQNKLHTSGNHNLKDIIYTIYGREIAASLVPLESQVDMISITGFIGKPVIARNNRNFENYFINGRYIRNNIICKAIEEAYKPFMMQHKYLFTLLHIAVEPEFLDVNVHPTKMELRFRDGETIFRAIRDAVSGALRNRELIPEVTLDEKKKREPEKSSAAENTPRSVSSVSPGYANDGTAERISEEQTVYHPHFLARTYSNLHVNQELTARLTGKPTDALLQSGMNATATPEKKTAMEPAREPTSVPETTPMPDAGLEPQPGTESQPVQMELFDGKLLEPKSRSRHRLIGQLFDTYWMVEFEDQLYIIDQHAAHEKVLYEKTMASLQTREYTCQQVNPPIILTLGSSESILLETHMEAFRAIGFEIEHFGGREYAVRGVPDNLFSIARKDLLLEMLDNLSEDTLSGNADMIREKIASMSCKAAVKGNHRMSFAEADKLIDLLLDLENPYACPHGRPTIISMSKYEIEKKFKRIL
ncbi:MAG: DNA mismatch repair endonuclease MutL [Clostridiales bacterium]|nr:DNA mismatch repair endonuclease MutL [Clostridiales bacterium]